MVKTRRYFILNFYDKMALFSVLCSNLLSYLDIGIKGFEPLKYRIQIPTPCHLAIPHKKPDYPFLILKKKFNFFLLFLTKQSPFFFAGFFAKQKKMQKKTTSAWKTFGLFLRVGSKKILFFLKYPQNYSFVKLRFKQVYYVILKVQAGVRF